MNFLRQFADWQLAIISGILIGAAYPPLPLGSLAWLGLVPLIHALRNTSPRTAFWLAYLSGSVANLVTLFWIGFNSGAGLVIVLASMLGAVLYLGIFWGLLGLTLAWLHKRWQIGLISWPFLWVAMEYLRSFGAMAFPWINLAATQIHFLPLIQSAEYFGSDGIAFWIVLLNVGFYRLLTDGSRRRSIGTIIFLGLVILFVQGSWRIRVVEQKMQEEGQPFKVALVQPNLNPNEKWEPDKREFVFERMDSLLVAGLALEPQMVIWPESAVPAYLRINGYRRKKISNRITEADIPLLTGSVDKQRNESDEWDTHNGSILIRPGDDLELYHKIHLVPFAEYIPLSWKFPILKKLNFGQGNFVQGNDYTVFEVDSIKFSTIICYESSMPRLVSRFIRRGARLITIQTNDAWVGKTSGPYQHFALAILRAVENRVPVIRCANTGISAYIGASGRVERQVDLDEAAVIGSTSLVPEKASFYSRHGDYFVYLSFIVFAIILGLQWKRNSN